MSVTMKQIKISPRTANENKDIRKQSQDEINSAE